MTLPNATRTGYDFAGWYTAATGGSLVGTNGASYTPNDNTTLYAHWTGYTVTYNANGGAVSPASDTVDSSGNVTLPTPSWAGHSFDGWYTAASGGTSVGAAGATYSPASSTTIYAHWTAYTVTYDANGGTVSPASASAGADGTVTLATPSVRTGYDFNGWYTATSGGTKIGEKLRAILLDKENSEMDAMLLTEPQASQALMKKHHVMLDTRKEDMQMGALVFRTKNMDDASRKHQMEVFMNGYKQACDSINHFGVRHYKQILKKYYSLSDQAIKALPDSLKFTYQAPRQKDIDCARKWLEKKKK